MRNKKLLVLATVAVALIGAGFVFVFGTVGGRAALERDEAGRIRSCGVRTSPNGKKYCASELAAKNPQAMHRCPGHDGAVIVKYVEADGAESQREICCICGLVQWEPQPHSTRPSLPSSERTRSIRCAGSPARAAPETAASRARERLRNSSPSNVRVDTTLAPRHRLNPASERPKIAD